MLVDVSATKGVLDLPNYVARIIKDNWTMEVYDLKLLKGPYAPSKEELMTALQLAMQCVTNPPLMDLQNFLNKTLLKSKA
jgi:hypothetical protein